MSNDEPGDAFGGSGDAPRPQDPEPWKRLRVRILDHIAESADAHLRSVVDRDVLGDLIPIWERFPGWTTPAEFWLTFFALQDIARRTAAIESAVTVVTAGAIAISKGELPKEDPTFSPDLPRWDGKHDVGILSIAVHTAREPLQRLVDRDAIRELLHLWKQPGWTTPAEFFLVHAALENIQSQVAHVERQILSLSNAAGLVAPEEVRG